MVRHNKRQRQIALLAAVKRSKLEDKNNVKDIELSEVIEPLSKDICDETAKNLTDIAEWHDFGIEGDSDDERHSISKESWDSLLKRMRSTGLEHGEHLRSSYTGSSERSIRRKKKTAEAIKISAVGTKDIRTYFQSPANNLSATEDIPEPQDVTLIEEDLDFNLDDTLLEEDFDISDESELTSNGSEDIDIELSKASDMVEDIESYLKPIRNKRNADDEEIEKLTDVQMFLRYRLLGMKRVQASHQVSLSKGKSPYWGRCIRAWADQWRMNKAITLSK
ncbi:hypothetical protein FBU30_001028 [Linnemannia zychae]|nr:hypothetical protein FBU30_001028 [Linnemannia zychae]